MNSPDHRHVRTAWIPWVAALVALLGLNVLVPADSHSRRSETADEIGLSQQADNAQPAGRIFNPLVTLAPGSSGEIGFLTASSSLLCLENRRDRPASQSPEGAVRGRAPPVKWIS
jgi:hypothetical protein